MHSLDNRHKWALPYWARPGIVSFAKAADAGGKDDDELDDDDEEDDEEDDDDDKTPEELTAELKAVREQLKGVNGQSAKRRRAVRELKAQLADKAGKSDKAGKADKEEDAPDLDAVRAAAKAEAKGEADATRKADKAELALARAGVDPARLAKAVKLLELDDVELNDDGTLDGIDEAIAELKSGWGELFATRRKRESVSGKADRDGGDEDKGSKGKSSSERQAALLLGR